MDLFNMFEGSTWACFIRLIFIISTVIGSITKPPFGYAAIIGTLELVNRATVVSWKEQQKQTIQFCLKKKHILYLRMLQSIFKLGIYFCCFLSFFFDMFCYIADSPLSI